MQTASGMLLTIRRPAPYVTDMDWNTQDQPQTTGSIPVGTTVKYDSHVVGGMLRVWYRSEFVIIHPATTVELG